MGSLKHGKKRRAMVATAVLVTMLAAGTHTASAGVGVDVIIVSDNQFTPERPDIAQVGSTGYNWLWDDPPTANKHNVHQDRELFNSGAPNRRGPFSVFPSAGRFPYHCDLHPGMTGQLRVRPVRGDIRTQGANPFFRVRWAIPDNTTGSRYDVRFRTDGGDWQSWFTDTPQRTALFGRDGEPIVAEFGHTYEFQARSQESGVPSHRSEWSPILFTMPL